MTRKSRQFGGNLTYSSWLGFARIGQRVEPEISILPLQIDMNRVYSLLALLWRRARDPNLPIYLNLLLRELIY